MDGVAGSVSLVGRGLCIREDRAMNSDDERVADEEVTFSILSTGLRS